MALGVILSKNQVLDQPKKMFPRWLKFSAESTRGTNELGRPESLCDLEELTMPSE